MPFILFVDDNLTLTRFSGALLQSRLPGYVVVTAECAAEARERAALLRPVLAIIDVRLPDGCGTDLVRDLARVVPSLRSILISAEPIADDTLESCKPHGCVGILTKPFQAGTLVNLARQALEDDGARAEQEPQNPTNPSTSFMVQAVPLRRQLSTILAGLLAIRDVLGESDLDEAHIDSLVETRLVPLIRIVSQIGDAMRFPKNPE